MMNQSTDEERELFRAVLAGKALHKAPRPQPKAARAKPAEKKAQAAPTGVDGQTGERLRRGTIVPDSKLDLHGLTENAAHRALWSFLQTAHKRGDRLVLVVGPDAMASDYVRQEWRFAYYEAGRCVNPIVRCDGRQVAIRTVQHEFRTAGVSSERPTVLTVAPRDPSMPARSATVAALGKR